MTDPSKAGADAETPFDLVNEAVGILHDADQAQRRLELPAEAHPYEALQRIMAQRQEGMGLLLLALATSGVESTGLLERLVSVLEGIDGNVRQLVEIVEDADRRIRNETRSDETLTEAIYPVPDMAPDAGIFIDVRDGGLAITQTLDFAVPIAVNGEWLPGTPRKRYVVNVGGSPEQPGHVERLRRNAVAQLRHIADLVEQGALL